MIRVELRSGTMTSAVVLDDDKPLASDYTMQELAQIIHQAALGLGYAESVVGEFIMPEGCAVCNGREYDEGVVERGEAL